MKQPKTLRVRATSSPVPREEAPRRSIGERPERVPDTPYYRRRLRAGELREVKAEADGPRPTRSPKPSKATTDQPAGEEG